MFEFLGKGVPLFHQTAVRHGFSLVLILLAGAFITSCQTSSNQEDEGWVDKTFHEVTYRVPPSWVEIRDRDSVQYKREEIQMNQVSLYRYEEGETLPESEMTVDPSREIWAYADQEFESLKAKPDHVRTQRKEQRRFPRLGKQSYLMKVRTMDGNGVSQRRWIIGALIDEYYYRIELSAERFGHLPAIQEAFTKFKTSLGIKSEKPASENE